MKKKERNEKKKTFFVAFAAIAAIAAIALLAIGFSGIAAAAPSTNNANISNDQDTNVTEDGVDLDLPVGHQISLLAREKGKRFGMELEKYAFQIAFKQAKKHQERVNLTQQKVNRLQEQLKEIQQERLRLVKQLRNDSITPQEFAARIAEQNRLFTGKASQLEEIRNTTREHKLNVTGTELNESLQNAVNALRNKSAANVSVLDNAREALQLAHRARSGNFPGPEIAEFARQLGMNKSEIVHRKGDQGGPQNVPGRAGEQVPGPQNNDTRGKNISSQNQSATNETDQGRNGPSVR